MDEEISALEDLLTKTSKTSPLVKILIPGSLWHEVRVHDYILDQSDKIGQDLYPDLDVTLIDYLSACVLEVARLGTYAFGIYSLLNN